MMIIITLKIRKEISTIKNSEEKNVQLLNHNHKELEELNQALHTLTGKTLPDKIFSQDINGLRETAKSLGFTETYNKGRYRDCYQGADTLLCIDRFDGDMTYTMELEALNQEALIQAFAKLGINQDRFEHHIIQPIPTR